MIISAQTPGFWGLFTVYRKRPFLGLYFTWLLSLEDNVHLLFSTLALRWAQGRVDHTFASSGNRFSSARLLASHQVPLEPLDRRGRRLGEPRFGIGVEVLAAL